MLSGIRQWVNPPRERRAYETSILGFAGLLGRNVGMGKSSPYFRVSFLGHYREFGRHSDTRLEHPRTWFTRLGGGGQLRFVHWLRSDAAVSDGSELHLAAGGSQSVRGDYGLCHWLELGRGD